MNLNMIELRNVGFKDFISYIELALEELGRPDTEDVSNDEIHSFASSIESSRT